MEFNNLSDLCFRNMPTDIKGLICSYLPVDTMCILSQCDYEVLKHIMRNRRQYVEQFTVMDIVFTQQSWKLFGKLHRENGLPALCEIVQQNTTGEHNAYVGRITTGSNSVAIGMHSHSAITTGCNGVAIGCNALVINTTGSHSTAVGYNSLVANTSGSCNVAIGWNSYNYTADDFLARAVIRKYYLNGVEVC